MQRIVVNVLVYQCVWFACVLSAAAQRPWIGMWVAGVAVLIHLGVAPAPRRELPLILLAALAGAAFESLLVGSGWVRPSPPLLVGWLPAWMVALWAAFALFAVFATTLDLVRWGEERLLAGDSLHAAVLAVMLAVSAAAALEIAIRVEHARNAAALAALGSFLVLLGYVIAIVQVG